MIEGRALGAHLTTAPTRGDIIVIGRQSAINVVVTSRLRPLHSGFIGMKFLGNQTIAIAVIMTGNVDFIAAIKIIDLGDRRRPLIRRLRPALIFTATAALRNFTAHNVDTPI